MKFSLLLGVLAGILSLIPIFGTILSTVPIVIIGLTSSFMTGVLALGWILMIHFVEANILNPKIIGSSAHIHPVIVIFALLAGESAFGAGGSVAGRTDGFDPAHPVQVFPYQNAAERRKWSHRAL